MAEEFDIQTIWNRSKNQQQQPEFELDGLKMKGTKTTLYWIKTILWIEFWLSIIGLPFMLWYFSNRGEGTWVYVLFTTFTLVYLFYYQFLIRQINGFSYDRNVLQSLKKVHGYLWFYLLHYKVVFWLSLAVGFFAAMFDPANTGDLDVLETTKQWAIAIIIWIVIFGIAGLIFHLIIYLIYGRKVKRIKRMIRELESLQ